MTDVSKPLTAHNSGSYLPGDVHLLLDMISADQINNTDPVKKEQLIQSGQQHYSDMLTLEKPPTAMHQQLYQQALEQSKLRMAQEIDNLAYSLSALFASRVTPEQPLVLVSLVRAGLPIGVLLQRALNNSQRYHLPSLHYGVSIIRDRGLDPVALQQILTTHPNSPVVFVDGWTGKGAIYGELQRSLGCIGEPQQQAQIFHQGEAVIPLVTLADPAGVAWLSASDDDWLMPASLLNSTVSGLISRTLYRKPSDGLHQAVFYHALKDYDMSLDFIAVIDELRQHNHQPVLLAPKFQPTFVTRPMIDNLATRFGIVNRNRIKPTIAEATRAILRRDPECVLVNDSHCPTDTVLLRHLCEERHIQLIDDPSIAPYTAVTLIKHRNG